MRSSTALRSVPAVPTRRVAILLTHTLAAATAVALAVGLAPARADTAPPSPATPPTVAADVLPTVQVDGVVWAQVVVGTTVYATGSFTSARPAGAAAGTGETARSNLLAYDLRTGALVTTWAPALNAQGLAIAASPDGARIYVAGDFTSVDGTARYRMAALDARTGALVTSFAPRFDARVRALAVTAGKLYAGGIFTTASGVARSRLAAVSTADGAVLPWAPGADAEVMALTVPAGGTKVVAAGRFGALGGAPARGTGAVDATTGAALPWAMNRVVMNSGPDAAILSLSNDGTTVYGTGYVYGGRGGNLEGAFAARASDGAVVWINGCLGDTYGIAAAGGVVYSVGHPHDCSSIGGFPQTEPWTYQRAMAVSAAPSATRLNTGRTFFGRPAPDLLHWLPTLAAGTYTGQSQAAWSVAATSDYVVIGGEFPKVNGVPQQGLARFATRALAPNHEGPQGGSMLLPTLTGVRRGTVAVRWTAAWDRDNTRLTYQVLRGETLAGAVVVGTLAHDGNWWTRPSLTVTDATAPPGTTATYRIRVTDPLGNTAVGNKTSVTVPVWP